MAPRPGPRRQRGAALLALAALVVLGATWSLLSALGSAAGRGQAQVAYNARVLAEAKAALIAWVAMRALEAAEENPGRLPCPQAWGDVGSAYEGRAAAVCSSAIGWLPWRTLGLPALTDATGAQLWYVVSPGWHLPNSGTALLINSNTRGQLTLDGRAAVAVVIAPGAALGADCQGRRQSQAMRLPAVPPNPRDFLDCYQVTASGTAFSTPAGVSNDQIVALTAADLLPSLEAAIAKRIEREIVPALKGVYASAAWGLDSLHPVFAFAAPFAEPGASSYQGRAGTFEGLLPFNQTQGCTSGARCLPELVGFAATPTDALDVLGADAIQGQTCLWESADARRCEGEYRASESQPWRPVRVEMSATFTNVAMGLRALDAARLQAFARGGAGEWQPLPVTHAATLNADGSATLRFGATLPNIGAMGWGTSARFRLRLERAVIADHALLDADDALTGWFVRNEWYRLLYYAIAPAHAASGAAPRACAADCLQVANLGTPGAPRAILILAGRSLGERTRPSGLLADYLEGANVAGPGFESRPVNAAFNDRIVVLDANP